MRQILVVIALILTVNSLSAQSRADKEFRGAWIHIVGNQKIKTMSSEAVQKMFTDVLDSLQKSNCNAVIFQIRPQADAFYASEIEPWSRFLTGVQGEAPNPYWDPLEFMIRESHKRGMELHAWLNPYRVTSNDSEQLHPDHLYFKNPSIFKKYGKQLYFDPGEPESKAHTIKVVADIVSRYNIDALHFDDYFYPYSVPFEEFHDDASFVKYAADQGFEYWEKNDWRRNNVATLIKELNDTIKAIKPWMRFGISPFGIHRNLKDTPDGSGSNTNGYSNYEQLFADVPDWARKGYIDYVVPQIYWKIGHPAADYTTLIEWWDRQDLGAQVYVGQNIATFDELDLEDSSTTQMATKMKLVRTLKNISGNVWWPGWDIVKNRCDIADSLTTTYQRTPSLIPPFTALDSIAPAPVKEIAKRGQIIKWKVEETDDKLQEVNFYAIYKFPAEGEIDISNQNYLLKITKDNFLKIGKKRSSSCPKSRYIVTVIDRCWNESSPSQIISAF